MKYSKKTALLATIGSIIVGNFASIYGFNVSGYINYFFKLDVNNSIYKEIKYKNNNMLDIIYKNSSLKTLFKKYIDKSYGKIVKFVDGGLFGDISYIYDTKKYSAYSNYFCGNFTEFQYLDGMFVCTLRYVSPFCMFNFSSLILEYYNEDISITVKDLIKNVLFLSDYWSLYIIYAIHLYDINNPPNKYHVIIYMKTNEKQIKTMTEKTIKTMPFEIEKNDKNDKNDDYQISLIDELKYILDKNTELKNKEYCNLQTTISCGLTAIMNFVNLLLLNTEKNMFQHILKCNSDTINNLYSESKTLLKFIHKNNDDFDIILTEEINKKIKDDID
jgi:hypothetical protein